MPRPEQTDVSPEHPLPRRPRERGGRPSVRTWLLVAVAVVVAVLVVAVTQRPWSLPWGAGPVPPAADDPDRIVTAGRAGVDEARLEITGDVQALTIRTDASGDDLVAVRPTGADRAASARVDGGDAVVVLGGGSVVVHLAPDVVWTVDLRAGAGSVQADLTGAQVGGIDLAAGAGSVELVLPEPLGSTPIDQRAGANSLLLRVPEGCGVQATVTSGLGSSTIDGETSGGLGAGAVVETDGFDASAVHYAVTVGGGLGSLTVDRG